VTVRALPELVLAVVELCDNAIEAEISSTLIASAVEAIVLNLVDTINLLSFWMLNGTLSRRAAIGLSPVVHLLTTFFSCCVVCAAT
jgi:uncharacterized membrane protein YhfC